MDTFLEFNNIEEIKFTKVGNNVFSISIKSDIRKDEIDFKNTVFEAQLCKLDPTLELKLGREYTDVETGNGFITKSETFNIPINIQLLLNNELRYFFTVKTKNK
jgi:hypothetical protein